jgi:hypothetical protein
MSSIAVVYPNGARNQLPAEFEDFIKGARSRFSHNARLASRSSFFVMPESSICNSRHLSKRAHFRIGCARSCAYDSGDAPEHLPRHAVGGGSIHDLFKPRLIAAVFGRIRSEDVDQDVDVRQDQRTPTLRLQPEKAGTGQLGVYVWNSSTKKK